MIVVTILPLFLMSVLNYMEYQKTMRGQIISPLRGLVNKTKHSFELFLTERRSALSFIASAYSFAELADEDNLFRLFQVMKREFGGFVDLGLIDSKGLQVSYVGPYKLAGKDYREQEWFKEVEIRGIYISDVFMGYRGYPHFVIAIQKLDPRGNHWFVRSTIDTEILNNLIKSMSLEKDSDAFLLNQSCILQTPSKFYGKLLQKCPFILPPAGQEPQVLETEDNNGQPVWAALVQLQSVPLTLVVVKPRTELWQIWYTFKNENFILFIASIIVIFLVVFNLTNLSVRRIEKLEKTQRQALHEMEQSNKLASIGRLAAGVAHEINNPIAIIDQKAGLMMDLLEPSPDFPYKDRFLQQAQSIIRAVDRCRDITHRLLGFARRMDVDFREIDLNVIIEEVLSFLGGEPAHRNVSIQLDLAEGGLKISSDQGQLQQVFLNILNNALAAVDEGGEIVISSWEKDSDTVAVGIQDNGIGMSKETKEHIFEPFFTTKKDYGTGLGLSITYGIVKKLGGDIQVESHEGIGTTFIVILPKRSNYGTGT
jgi:two-component system NtrC family sensor kinase